MPRILLPNGKAVFSENPIPDDQLEAFVASQMSPEEVKPSAPSMSVGDKRKLRTANDSALSAGIKDSDVNTDTYKGPDSFLGGFFNSLGNSLKETFGGNQMLKDAAHPVSTGDMLGLLIPQEAAISQALSGAKRLLGFGTKAAEVVPEVAKAADDLVLPPKPAPKLLKPGTDFIAGPAGVAENRPYRVDTGPIAQDTGELGTVLPQEMGEVVDLPPDMVARAD